MPAPRFEPGTYDATVVSARLGESSSGIPQLRIRFTVGPKAQEADLYLYFSEASFERSAKDLVSLGYPCRAFSQIENHNFSGTRFRAYCKHEDYKGNPHEKWSIAFADKEDRPIQADKLRSLDQKLASWFEDNPPAQELTGIRNDLVSQPKPRQQAKLPPDIDTSNMPPTALFITDDDVPF